MNVRIFGGYFFTTLAFMTVACSGASESPELLPEQGELKVELRSKDKRGDRCHDVALPASAACLEVRDHAKLAEAACGGDSVSDLALTSGCGGGTFQRASARCCNAPKPPQPAPQPEPVPVPPAPKCITGTHEEPGVCASPSDWKEKAYYACSSQGLTLADASPVSACKGQGFSGVKFTCCAAPPPPTPEPPSPVCYAAGFTNANGACSSKDELRSRSEAACKDSGGSLSTFEATNACKDRGFAGATFTCCLNQPPPAPTPPVPPAPAPEPTPVPPPPAPSCVDASFTYPNGMCTGEVELQKYAAQGCQSAGLKLAKLAGTNACKTGGFNSAAFTCCP